MREELPSIGQRRSKRALWLALLACGLLAAFGLVLVVVLHRKARSHGEQVRAEIEKRLEVLRGKGEPVTLGELAKRYPDPPPEKDASRLMKATLEALRASDSETNANFFLSDKRFQARTEPLPNNLLEAMRVSELVPDYLPVVPADPYDDQPLRYRKLPRGYVVYSIGPDFTDNGGKEQSADMKEGEPYDITFTIER